MVRSVHLVPPESRASRPGPSVTVVPTGALRTMVSASRATEVPLGGGLGGAGYGGAAGIPGLPSRPKPDGRAARRAQDHGVRQPGYGGAVGRGIGGCGLAAGAAAREEDHGSEREGVSAVPHGAPFGGSSSMATSGVPSGVTESVSRSLGERRSRRSQAHAAPRLRETLSV